MTEDYKEKLLKYMTHNLQKQEGVNIPEFSDIVETDATDIYDAINTAFPYGVKQLGQLQCKNNDGEYNGFIIIYGNYYTDSNKDYETSKGYLLLFDNNFNLVQIIKQYKSGTDLGRLYIIEVMTDGTLVGMDHHNNKNRFIMLNNPSVKLPAVQNYELVLRTSYNLQGNINNIDFYIGTVDHYIIDKDPNSASYILAEAGFRTGIKYMTKLKINVGSANEWTNYTYQHITNSSYEGSNENTVYTYINWQNEVPYMYVYNFVQFWKQNPTFESLLQFYLSTNNGTTTIGNAQLIKDYGIIGGEGGVDGYKMAFIGLNNYYLMLASATMNGGYDQVDCKITIDWFKPDNTVEEIYKDEYLYINHTGGTALTYFDLNTYNLNGTICITYSANMDGTNIGFLMKSIALLITSDGDVAVKEIGTPIYHKYIQFHLNTIINQFDLYKYYILFEDLELGWMLNRSDIIYNYLYYNGAPYENVNSLRANQGMLFDINGNIFVRGIYNHIVADNTTEDTIQVPNTMVNNIQITQNKLMSQTNIPMVINNDTIEKNIYETLYINYFNTINMENRNTAYYIQNKDGAIRVNNAISNLLDYDNMTITKIKINYHDSTNMISEIQPATITNGVATFTFSVYIGKAIDSIDLISDDEATTYISIDATGYQLNKLYNISQNCFIE